MSEITLNKSQEKAVKYFQDKPLLIEAGPGSGKTRVLIERIKFLVNEKNINPESLLVITFSNKAAKELMDRLIDSKNGLDKESVNRMHISTIHSFCHTLLSEYGISFDILDGEESNNMFIYKNLKNLGFVDEKTFKKRHTPQLVSKYNELTSFKVDIDEFEKYVYDNFPVSDEYLDFIKEAIENEEDEYFSFPEQEVKDNNLKDDWYNARYQHICESYRKYLQFLNDETLIDYALLQTRALELLESTPNMVSELKYKNILIDEFQDTDPVQMKIFDILMKNAKTFTVVGDDEQSIYAFRGSSVRFFKEFEEKYNAEVIALDVNYRSTESIVKFSENFIEKDRDSDSAKSLHADSSNEGPERSVYHLHNQDKNDEAINVAKLIKFLKESGKISNYGSVGILSRAISGKRILSLVKNLKKENIPYDVVGNQDLLEKDEIKSLLLLFYYLIENDEKPYILNKWEFEWMNISGFASAAFNALKIINLSENTRNVLLELEKRYKEKVMETEKEVYKEFEGKNSRLRSFKGVFNRDEEILIEIFNRVKKPFLWKYDTEILREIGITDVEDLEFFNKLYNLRKELENQRENDNVKYGDISTLLEVFYNLLDISSYFNIPNIEDEENLEELGNLGIVSKILYNLEDVITRTNLRTMFWYLYYNLENYDSKTIDQEDEVQIMTVHKSKGLEFPVIIVYGLQADVFPSKFRNDENKLTGLMGVPMFPVPDEFAEYKENLTLTEKEKNEYLEERRVLYVAMTRAEDILVLSTRLDKNEHLPVINGIDFNPLILPNISEDFSILPKTQGKHRQTEKEILSLSYTSLQNYEICPFKYYIKYNLLFTESETIFIKKGHLVHKFLDKIHKSIKNDEEFNLDEMVEKHATENERDKNKKEIENIYKYVEKDLKGLRILDSEVPFQIEKEDCIIDGKIDLIYEKDGKIGIMDFKTSSTFNEEEVKQQLYIYLMALNENPNYKGKIDELAIYLVNSQKIETYKIDYAYLKSLQTNIHKIANEINNNKFNRKPGAHCNSCTFNFICEQSPMPRDINKPKSEFQGANLEAIDKLITAPMSEYENLPIDSTPDENLPIDSTPDDELVVVNKPETEVGIPLEKEELEKINKETDDLKEILKEKEDLIGIFKEKEELLRTIKEKENLIKILKETDDLKTINKETKDLETIVKEKEKLEKILKEKKEMEKTLKEKKDLEKTLREKEKLLSESFKTEIYELENQYQSKEKTAIEQIEKRFTPPQITYSRFIGLIEACNLNFNKQKETALNIIEIGTIKTPKADEELKKRLDALKSITEKLEDLSIELAITSGESGEKSSDEVEFLLEDMEKLIDSVKDYD